MSTIDRTKEILRIVNTKGSVSIGELAKATYASPSTIRRDIEKLEGRGLLRRHHGGVESVLTLNPPRVIRSQHNQKEKSIIAQTAATLVTPNSTIFMDASTTVQYMIPYLVGVEGLTVYTNGIDTALSLSKLKIRVISTGGELFSESMAFVGETALDAVRSLIFDATFFSSAGYDDNFITDWSEDETVLRRAVIRQSKKVYLLADHTKRGKCYTHIVCRRAEVDEVISDGEDENL